MAEAVSTPQGPDIIEARNKKQETCCKHGRAAKNGPMTTEHWEFFWSLLVGQSIRRQDAPAISLIMTILSPPPPCPTQTQTVFARRESP